VSGKGVLDPALAGAYRNSDSMKKLPRQKTGFDLLSYVLPGATVLFFVAFLISIYALISGLESGQKLIDGRIVARAILQRFYLLGISLGCLILWGCKIYWSRRGTADEFNV